MSDVSGPQAGGGCTTLISILSPVHNESKHIEEMITSLQHQTHTNWECVFVDDGSDDDTPEIIDASAALDKRIRLVHRGSRIGKSAAFNLAFREAKGDVIVLLAGDDRLPPHSLEVRAADLAGDPNDLNLAAYKLQAFSEDPRYDNMVLPRSPAAVSYSGGTLTMSRGLARLLFPVPESLPSEDLWLGYAAPKIASRVVENPTVILEYRIHPGNSNPRQAKFAEMDARIAPRHEAFKLLAVSTLPLDGVSRTHFHALWNAEQLRRQRKLLAITRAQGLTYTERGSFLAMASPTLFRLRSRFYKFFSGRQGR